MAACSNQGIARTVFRPEKAWSHDANQPSAAGEMSADLEQVPVPLEAVLCTSELHQRSCRQPDFQSENRALATLIRALADAPHNILQTLTDVILEMFNAGSAGISLLSEDETSFFWPAVSGLWRGHIGGGTPRNFGPCGDVLDRGAALLFKRVERRYPYLQIATPPAEECLLVPFHVQGKAVGTIWAIAHDHQRKFDTEDLRQLESLGRFASAAYQAVGSLELADAQARASLSLSDDARQSHDALELLYADLRESEAFSRSIVESSPDCIKVLDLDGNLLSMASGQELLGIDDIGPFLNKQWVEFWQGEDRLAAQAAIDSATAGTEGKFVGLFTTPRGDAKWWDVSTAPILGVDGKPRRLLAVSRDVTQRRRAELTTEFMASVNLDLATLADVDEMMRTVGKKMAAFLDLSVCAFVEISEAAERVVVSHDWHREDVPGLVGAYPLADFVGPEFILAARAGEVIVVHDTHTDPRTDPEHFAVLKIASFICVPLIRDGQWRYALCLYHSTPHDWRKDEVEVARELTTRVWTRLERLRTEQALRESEQRYRLLFESMDEGFCIIERVASKAGEPLDFRYLEANPAFEAQSGVRDVVGKTIREVVPGVSEEWFQTYESVLTTGEPIRFVRSMAPSDRVLELYSFPIGEDSRPRVAVIFRDVTQRIHAEEALRASEERFRALFDRGPIAMYFVGISGTIQEFNRSALDLWGQEPRRGDSDRDFRGLFRFYRPDGTPISYDQSPMTAVLRGESPGAHNLEVAFERPDGSRITVIANILPLKDDRGDITGVMNCFYDISDRKRLEHKSREQTQALADLDRRKDEFLAMLSHELRNPLASLSNATHLLRLQKNEDSIQQQARGLIERQVGQLKNLVDDLLEISRITTGRVQLRPEAMVLSGVVERALETVQPLIDQKRHRLSVAMPAEPVCLYADAARLEQVVVNLLTNAAKYTDEGGDISISLQQEADRAVLRVRDTGIGIAPELLPRIFDLFSQAERSLDRSQGGLGIGLCLVHRLVELHGGTVEAHSSLGQGSEFIVRLPVMLATVPALPSVELVPPRGKRCRVLVVDDNVDSAMSLAMLLEMSGHDARMAHDGHAALETALGYRPDAVLLDIGLPGLNGFEVAKRIRQLPTLEHIELIAMTGYGQDSDRQLSQQAGFDHHLVKPADFDKVLEILATVSAKGD